MNGDEDFAAFKRRTAELGLRFSDEDLAELYRGWRGVQPQLARLRQGLDSPAPSDDPP